MSAGRPRYSLAGLQAAAEAGKGSEVATMLLDRPVVAAPVKRAPAVRPEPEPMDPLLLSTTELGYTVPADYQYRTTPEDMRADICEMAELRVGKRLAPYVRKVAERSLRMSDVEEELGVDGFLKIRDQLDRCRREYMATIDKPHRPKKTPAVVKPRQRMEAPCSAVVRRWGASGRMFVDGREVTVEQAAAALQVPAEAV